MKLYKAIFFLFISLLSALSLSLESTKNPQHSDVETKTIVQRLDHFNAMDTNVWKQRYFQNMNFYEAGGPIFLVVGGEWTLYEYEKAKLEDGPYQVYGRLAKWAKQYKAAIFYLEHRYYGESIPKMFEDREDFTWLSSRQALNDIAEFVQQMNQKHKLTGPWISLGCSYGGTLATWIRSKYPHLIHGAIASSAPVLAADVNLPRMLGSAMTSNDKHSWLYQVCSEFGWEGGENLPRDCPESFGHAFTNEYMEELRNNTNVYYGAKELDVENVVFITGEIDVWTPFAITEDLNDKSPAIQIKNGGHCHAFTRYDLILETPKFFPESDSIDQAVMEIEQNIKKWIEGA